MRLFKSLTLPNGTTLPNRIAKAAMEENMANASQAPSNELITLYEAWADGGSGLLITGNVMVDRHAMTGPGGVVLEDDQQLPQFQRWAQAGKRKGAQLWMQISHPGRQMPAKLAQPTWAPSAVPVDLGALSKHFAPPIAMTQTKIEEIISRFVRTAQLAEQAGFDGVEVHAAHGYLLSQFLSPLTNKRTDQWGGTLENRARLLTEIIKGIRSAVTAKFAVAVKLNSADFQRGGFSQHDAAHVIRLLNDLNVDMVELSGGSYEAPAMQGSARDGRTLAREAYFLEFARDLQTVARMPIMVTGGIRRIEVANEVLSSGVSMVGMATALAIAPALPIAWQQGQDPTPQLAPINWRNKALASLAYMAVVKYQLVRLSQNRKPKPKVSALWALIKNQIDDGFRTARYKRRMSALS